jgi:hypothetical protein
MKETPFHEVQNRSASLNIRLSFNELRQMCTPAGGIEKPTCWPSGLTSHCARTTHRLKQHIKNGDHERSLKFANSVNVL